MVIWPAARALAISTLDDGEPGAGVGEPGAGVGVADGAGSLGLGAADSVGVGGDAVGAIESVGAGGVVGLSVATGWDVPSTVGLEAVPGAAVAAGRLAGAGAEADGEVGGLEPHA